VGRKKFVITEKEKKSLLFRRAVEEEKKKTAVCVLSVGGKKGPPLINAAGEPEVSTLTSNSAGTGEGWGGPCRFSEERTRLGQEERKKITAFFWTSKEEGRVLLSKACRVVCRQKGFRSHPHHLEEVFSRGRGEGIRTPERKEGSNLG